MKLQVILAREESSPEGVSPISWLLLTSLEINSLEDVARCVRWYTYRWLIERYHYTLKSGCGIEKLQLETTRRIHMALATYSIVAWRLLWLTYEARKHPHQPCEVVLETHEWQALCVTISQNPHRQSSSAVYFTTHLFDITHKCIRSASTQSSSGVLLPFHFSIKCHLTDCSSPQPISFYFCQPLLPTPFLKPFIHKSFAIVKKDPGNA